MAIVHMKKLRLMVVRRQKDELLRELMLLGCVQISDPDALLADTEAAAVLRQESGNVTEVRSELTRLTAALKLLDKYAPVKSKLLSSRPEVTEADFLDDGAYRQELDAVAQLEDLEAAVRRYNGEEAKLRGNIEALRPWQTLDLPLDLGETVRTRISLGMLPAAVDHAEAAKALADAAPESQLYEISSDKEQHYVLLICLKEELTEAITALRASGFTLANLSGTPGTAKQNIEDAQQQIADIIRKREQAETDIAAFAPHRDAFKLCIDRASVKLGRAEAEERLVGTESVVCMRGWLTAPEEDKLTAVLAKYDCAWDLADPTEDEYPEVPVKLKNNKFTEPLNMVTNMYSLPAYGRSIEPAHGAVFHFVLRHHDGGHGLRPCDDDRGARRARQDETETRQQVFLRAAACLRRVDVPARHRDGRLLRQRRADDREHVRPRRQARHPDKPAARPADRYDDDPRRRYGARLYPARDRHDREHGRSAARARSATRSSTRAHGWSCLRDLRCMCSRSATLPASRSCCASAV
ncbi:MAG: hypothetical protein ACLRRN_07235 [Oscillospiraceae bacterium]